MNDNFANCSKAKYVGTFQGIEHSIGLVPSPYPGHPEYHKWKPHFTPHGPMGLMLAAAHRFALTIDNKFYIQQKHEAIITILSGPMQDLKPLVIEAIARARTFAAARERTLLPSRLEEAWNVVYAAKKGCTEDEERQLRYIMTLSEVDQVKAATLDADLSNRCKFCGHEAPTFRHVYWECQALHAVCPLPDFNHRIIKVDFFVLFAWGRKNSPGVGINKRAIFAWPLTVKLRIRVS